MKNLYLLIICALGFTRLNAITIGQEMQLKRAIFHENEKELKRYFDEGGDPLLRFSVDPYDEFGNKDDETTYALKQIESIISLSFEETIYDEDNDDEDESLLDFNHGYAPTLLEMAVQSGSFKAVKEVIRNYKESERIPDGVFIGTFCKHINRFLGKYSLSDINKQVTSLIRELKKKEYSFQSDFIGAFALDVVVLQDGLESYMISPLKTLLEEKVEINFNVPFSNRIKSLKESEKTPIDNFYLACKVYLARALFDEDSDFEAKYLKKLVEAFEKHPNFDPLLNAKEEFFLKDEERDILIKSLYRVQKRELISLLENGFDCQRPYFDFIDEEKLKRAFDFHPRSYIEYFLSSHSDEENILALLDIIEKHSKHAFSKEEILSKRL